MIKSLSILTRKPELTHAQFKEAWLGDHAPMVRAIPEVKKYVLSFVTDQPNKAMVAVHGISVDAIAELWYEDKAALARAGARPEMTEILKNGALYLGGIKTIITEEVDII